MSSCDVLDVMRPGGCLVIGGCACRKYHLCWSCSVVVFVEDAAQTWASADVELTDVVMRGERHRRGLEWSGVGDALVWPVVVVEALVFAECVE